MVLINSVSLLSETELNPFKNIYHNLKFKCYYSNLYYTNLWNKLYYSTFQNL